MNVLETSETSLNTPSIQKPRMTLDKILQDIHALEEDILMYERKYNMAQYVFPVVRLR